MCAWFYVFDFGPALKKHFENSIGMFILKVLKAFWHQFSSDLSSKLNNACQLHMFTCNSYDGCLEWKFIKFIHLLMKYIMNLSGTRWNCVCWRMKRQTQSQIENIMWMDFYQLFIFILLSAFHIVYIVFQTPLIWTNDQTAKPIFIT